MLHRWDGTGQVISDGWFLTDMLLRIEAKQFNLGFISPEKVCFSLESFRCFFVNSKRPFMCLSWGEAYVWPLCVAVMVVLLEVSPISTQDLRSSARVTIGFLSPFLPRPFLLDCSVWPARPALGRVLVVPNFFHLRIMVATVRFGTFNWAKLFVLPSPNLCLGRQFFLPHGLVFALIWIVSCETLSDSCVPFRIMSNQFFYFYINFISDFIPFSPNLVANLTPISSISPSHVTYLDPLHTPHPLAATVGI